MLSDLLRVVDQSKNRNNMSICYHLVNYLVDNQVNSADELKHLEDQYFGFASNSDRADEAFYDLWTDVDRSRLAKLSAETIEKLFRYRDKYLAAVDIEEQYYCLLQLYAELKQELVFPYQAFMLIQNAHLCEAMEDYLREGYPITNPLLAEIRKHAKGNDLPTVFSFYAYIECVGITTVDALMERESMCFSSNDPQRQLSSCYYTLLGDQAHFEEFDQNQMGEFIDLQDRYNKTADLNEKYSCIIRLYNMLGWEMCLPHRAFSLICNEQLN